MIENFLSELPNNTEVIGIGIIFSIILIISFIKKIEKIIIIILIGLIIYAGYLYYNDKEPSEKEKQIIEKPHTLIKK
jgi:hypothetical protein|tara:strand:+ start:418 stop:648 length:231 start_codon:yes stop_codon:yes gene_type:complete